MTKLYHYITKGNALNYAKKHLNNKFTKIMRCYTGFEVKIVVRTMSNNKSKNFYILKSLQKNILRAEIKNLGILETVFELADKE